jgi:Ser/Thr protein kinase RdoA (MazF antagonist)
MWHRMRVPQPPPSIHQVGAWLADWELPTPLRVTPLRGGFTSHVWRIDAGGAVFVSKLAYQPRADVEGGLRAAAILARHGLRTGPALHTRTGQLTRLVEYPAGHWHPLALLRFVEGEPLDWRTTEALGIAGDTLGTIHRALLEVGSLKLPDQLTLTDVVGRAFNLLRDGEIANLDADAERPRIRASVLQHRSLSALPRGIRVRGVPVEGALELTAAALPR